jgi:hypothetical protein
LSAVTESFELTTGTATLDSVATASNVSESLEVTTGTVTSANVYGVIDPLLTAGVTDLEVVFTVSIISVSEFAPVPIATLYATLVNALANALKLTAVPVFATLTAVPAVALEAVVGVSKTVLVAVFDVVVINEAETSVPNTVLVAVCAVAVTCDTLSVPFVPVMEVVSSFFVEPGYDFTKVSVVGVPNVTLELALVNVVSAPKTESVVNGFALLA